MNVIVLSVLVCVTYAHQEPVTKTSVSKFVYNKTYKPDWSDLDTRPLPQWYDSAKIGIFLHWGVYSVPSFKSEWFWADWKGGNNDIIDFMKINYPGMTYQEFAPMFTATSFDPKEWAQLFAKSGAKYIVLTSKHHEGFTLFPSKRSFSWNSVDIGPKLDILKALSQAVRRVGLKFGVYHSLYEWYNPIYLEDHTNNFTTTDFTDQKLWPDIKQIINDYKPSVLWADGDWEANDTYWRSTDLLAWLYNESPVKDEIVVNDRWGKNNINCHHGDFYNCKDRYDPGVLVNHKWEDAFTLDEKSWGFRRNIKITEIMSINKLLHAVVSVVSCGGNALINVGPTKDGIIIPIFQERLLQLGEFLDVNGEAIYDTSPWLFQNDSLNADVWYTCKKKEYNPIHQSSLPTETDIITAVYAIFLKWPQKNILSVRNLAPYLHKGIYHVDMLGPKVFKNLNWQISKGVTEITLPDKADVTTNYAWALKISS